ncbi:MAG: filamentous hemagglutinin N-terminal domain-containing protein [Cyanobacteria bacterium P01_F01_bin.150]
MQNICIKLGLSSRPELWMQAIASSLCILAGLWYDSGHRAVAQIAPDSHLSTIVTTENNLNFAIDGGQRAGSNLFHSFQEFSIPTDGSAIFNNAVDLDAIINRVTGDLPSNIDGLLQTNGDADLFLLNPNGLIFGPNAQLNIGGSFVATSAERILFEDGTFFSTSDTLSDPILTMSAPIGLQMGSSSMPITLQGDGHQLDHRLDFAPIQNLTPSQIGLQVQADETLALIGAGLTLEGAILTAPSGHIELGSVAEGTVQWSDDWTFNYNDVNAFQDMQLSQRALVDVSDRQSGSVHVYGSRVQLDTGATIFGQQFGTQTGGLISLQGSNEISLRGTAPGGTPRTQVRVETTGSGRGSPITVSTQLFRVRGGSAVVSATFGAARAGDITIQDTNQVKITGFSASSPGDTSALSAVATLSIGGRGRAGNIFIDVDDQLRLRDGGSIVSLALLGSGSGGKIDIESPSIRVQGISPVESVAGISSATIGSGDAGNIDIKTDALFLGGGALIDSSSIEEGNAGDITIEASERIQVDGFVETDLNTSGMVSSGINSVTSSLETSSITTLPGVNPIPNGNAGAVRLTTPRLVISNQGQISTRTAGPGDVGTININASVIELNSLGRIIATTENGNGGAIRINTDRLTLDNGLINASVLGEGERGSTVSINATESIEISGNGGQTLFTNTVQPVLVGNFMESLIEQGIWAIATNNSIPGNISLETNNLLIRNGSVVANATFIQPDDSTITDSGRAVGVRTRPITTDINARQTAADIAEPIVEPTIRINANGTVDIRASIVTSSTQGQGQGFNAGNIEINTQRLFLKDGGIVVATTLGDRDGGDLRIDASESIELQGRSPLGGIIPSGLYADAQNEATGKGGSLRIETPLLILQNGATISVNTNTEIVPSTHSSSRTTSQVPMTDDFDAGNINAYVDLLVLDQSRITASSPRGEGGRITLESTDGLVMRNSSILTEAGTEERGGGDGGNIEISTPLIAAFDDSDIVANAVGGDGGDINIESLLIAALDDSDIVANASEGNGGNIEIATQGLFGIEFRDTLTDKSDITASSRSGLDGMVTITTPNVNPASDTILLPSTVLSSTQSIVTACGVSANSRFNITGRGGIPMGPEGSGIGDRPFTSLLPDFGHIPSTLEIEDMDEAVSSPLQPSAMPSMPSMSATTQNLPDTPPVNTERRVQEATAMAIDSNGQVQFIAATSPSIESPVSCVAHPSVS